MQQEVKLSCSVKRLDQTRRFQPQINIRISWGACKTTSAWAPFQANWIRISVVQYKQQYFLKRPSYFWCSENWGRLLSYFRCILGCHGCRGDVELVKSPSSERAVYVGQKKASQSRSVSVVLSQNRLGLIVFFFFYFITFIRISVIIKVRFFFHVESLGNIERHTEENENYL